MMLRKVAVVLVFAFCVGLIPTHWICAGCRCACPVAIHFA